MPPNSPASKPATGLAALGRFRVLDLTRVRSGPTCVRVLADFGADVIRIESPPGLDPTQGTMGARDSSDALNLHRNKRSIIIDLKKPEARDVVRRLLARIIHLHRHPPSWRVSPLHRNRFWNGRNSAAGSAENRGI